MLVACWSVKGGSGTTVVASALALLLARRLPGGVLLVDLAGDLPAALGVVAHGPGLSDWLAAGAGVPAGALARLEVEVPGSVRLLPLGSSPLSCASGDDASARFVTALRNGAPAEVEGSETVVVDAGRPEPGSLANDVVAAATRSLLVLRPCYLALRRAVASSVRPTGVVLVDEPARALGPADVEDAIGAPIVAVVPHRPEIARAVDAGMLAGRLPRTLASSLRAVA